MGKSESPEDIDRSVYIESIIEITPNMVVLFDTENHIQEMSLVARKILGIDDTVKYRGKSIFYFIKNQVLMLLIKNWFEKIQKGLSVDETIPFDRKGNNEYEWFQVRAQAIQKDGKIIGKAFFITEVTLLYSHKKLVDTLLLSSPGDIFVFDRNMQILAVSDSVARINGFYSWRELIGKNLQDLPSVDHKFFKSMQEAAILQDEPVHRVIQKLAPKGEMRWHYVDLRTIKSTAGVFGYIMTEFDITGEIQPKAILESLMESTSDAIVIVNPDGIIEYVSLPLARVLGFHDWRTAINKHWSFLFKGVMSEVSKFTELFSSSTGHSKTGTISITVGDAPEHYNYRIAPLVFEGKNLGFISIASNTTELIQERNKAESAVRAKAAFLANMSHELRTPMNAVLGMNELLSRTTLNSLQKNYSAHIRSSATMLLSIINDILDFSRIEDSKLELVKSAYNVSSMLHDVINLVAVKVAEKELSFTVDIDPSLPSSLIGDELRVKQILVNLLNNAVKFTDSGEVNLSIIPLQAIDGKSVWINFHVRDTGIGIPKERQVELFERFNRIDSGRSQLIEGSGLGLAICKGLVTLMGGTLTLESDDGIGSVFTAGINQIIGENSEPIASFAGSSSSTVLVFDADPLTLASIRKMLSYDTITASFCSDSETFRKMLEEGNKKWSHVVFEYRQGYDIVLETIVQWPQVKWLSLLTMTDFLGKGKHPSIDFLFKPLVISSFSRFLRGEHVDFSTSLPLVNSMGVQPLYFRASGVTVLVVDDSTVNLKVAEGFLQTLDIRCDAADNGEDAIMKASGFLYDLVLMDHMMPKMDGLETTKKIRKLPGYRDVPIIALTANAGESYRLMYREAGMNDTLYKPIEFNAFVACLKKWLPVSKTTAATATTTTIVPPLVKEEIATETWIPGLDKASGMTYTGSLKNLEMILKVFERTGQKMLDQLEMGKKSGNASVFRSAVHPLISSGANIGAVNLSSYARELEQAILAGKSSDIDLLYPLLHEELKKVITGVSVHFDKGQKNGEKKV
ncbi:MAG TPA: response regulator [Treponemataceae bacterium]|nr:response regulator [Treponemataceae bacterium]